jgi:hypothetical protein
MDRDVHRVEYNWFYTNESGDEYGVAEIGKYDAVRIVYHTPQGEGDRHYCDVYYNDRRERVFNISRIIEKSINTDREDY